MSDYEGYSDEYGKPKKKCLSPLMIGGIFATMLLIGGGVAAALLLTGGSEKLDKNGTMNGSSAERVGGAGFDYFEAIFSKLTKYYKNTNCSVNMLTNQYKTTLLWWIFTYNTDI